MDRKALFRSKLRESKQKQQQEKRIESPLVRYNEYDQPICRVCNITLKSEALWPAHQVSKKHHEAIENLKSAAAGASRGSNANTVQVRVTEKAKPSAVPTDFFDGHGAKRSRPDAGSLEKNALPGVSGSGKEVVELSGTPVEAHQKMGKSIQPNLAHRTEETNSKKLKGNLPVNFFDVAQNGGSAHILGPDVGISHRNQVKKVVPDNFFDSVEIEDKKPNQSTQPAKLSSGPENKPVKGTLPEGFFDNKEADLHARGIQPVKVDINDAYKEFEKEIQENLQEVDERLEEEEIDAATEQEQYLNLEQREYREKVDMIKKKMIEAKAVQNAKVNKKSAVTTGESSDESSSDDDGDEGIDFSVDWRAQHLK